MQMATNDLMSFHLLIYVLTIECLRGFNIKSKGFVNVHEMYIPIVTGTVYLYVGNNIARAGADPGLFVRRSRFSDVIRGGGEGEKKYLKLC